MSKTLGHSPPAEISEAPPRTETQPAHSVELAAEQTREFAIENEERLRKAAEELARLQAQARHD